MSAAPVYEERFLLRSKDVDMFRRMRTSLVFERLQEASIRHTEQLGMGREKTLDKGILWVIGMQRAEIARLPEYDETVVLKSWPGDMMHLFFPRYYSMETEAGEPLLKASAMWMLIEQEDRSLVFPEEYGVQIAGVVTGGEIAQPGKPRRMECTDETTFTVPFSYVDLNGHMNNTRYFDLADDVLPAPAAGKKLREIQTEYVSEARFGEQMTVKWAHDGDDYYITGECGKPRFRMRLKYED